MVEVTFTEGLFERERRGLWSVVREPLRFACSRAGLSGWTWLLRTTARKNRERGTAAKQKYLTFDDGGVVSGGRGHGGGGDE